MPGARAVRPEWAEVHVRRAHTQSDVRPRTPCAGAGADGGRGVSQLPSGRSDGPSPDAVDPPDGGGGGADGPPGGGAEDGGPTGGDGGGGGGPYCGCWGGWPYGGAGCP